MNTPILFIHSSFEYLGCFHFGAIINNTIMTIHIQVFYRHMFSHLLNIFLEVEWLGHMVTLCLTL